MTLDPQTTVGDLLRAIPSSAAVFEKLGISMEHGETKSLRDLCSEHHVSFEQFLRAMDEIDWNEEPSRTRESSAPLQSNG